MARAPGASKTGKSMSSDRDIIGRLDDLWARLAPPDDSGKAEVNALARRLITHPDELKQFEEWARARAARGGLL
jgi:hypothetical protein